MTLLRVIMLSQVRCFIKIGRSEIEKLLDVLDNTLM